VEAKQRELAEAERQKRTTTAADRAAEVEKRSKVREGACVWLGASTQKPAVRCVCRAPSGGKGVGMKQG
jgi:hypothetical protein